MRRVMAAHGLRVLLSDPFSIVLENAADNLAVQHKSRYPKTRPPSSTWEFGARRESFPHGERVEDRNARKSPRNAAGRVAPAHRRRRLREAFTRSRLPRWLHAGSARNRLVQPKRAARPDLRRAQSAR